MLSTLRSAVMSPMWPSKFAISSSSHVATPELEGAHGFALSNSTRSLACARDYLAALALPRAALWLSLAASTVKPYPGGAVAGRNARAALRSFKLVELCLENRIPFRLGLELGR